MCKTLIVEDNVTLYVRDVERIKSVNNVFTISDK